MNGLLAATPRLGKSVKWVAEQRSQKMQRNALFRLQNKLNQKYSCIFEHLRIFYFIGIFVTCTLHDQMVRINDWNSYFSFVMGTHKKKIQKFDQKEYTKKWLQVYMQKQMNFRTN